ncbi:MAG TPA: hypothetical protein PLN48_08495 [Lachnospiraceae bacterium]|mgnify:CR=1 FL=1|nr:hypothetical protein [Lachnospiraceae bacterium]
MGKIEKTERTEDVFLRGSFVRELSNRFLAEIDIGGNIEVCYVPSSCKLSRLMDLSGRETLFLPVKKKDAMVSNQRTYVAKYKEN